MRRWSCLKVILNVVHAYFTETVYSASAISKFKKGKFRMHIDNDIFVKTESYNEMAKG